jgi:hypothetical protein
MENVMFDEDDFITASKQLKATIKTAKQEDNDEHAMRAKLGETLGASPAATFANAFVTRFAPEYYNVAESTQDSAASRALESLLAEYHERQVELMGTAEAKGAMDVVVAAAVFVEVDNRRLEEPFVGVLDIEHLWAGSEPRYTLQG